MRHLILIAMLTFASSSHAADALPVEFPTADGITVRGDAQGDGAHGVLLLHDEGGSAADWAEFSGHLSQAGFRVLSVDLRGHGRTGGAAPNEEDWVKMTSEVKAGIAWLRSKGATQVTLVGARIGGSLALQVASADPAISGVAVLSPVLSAHGVKLGGALAGLASRPTLFVASREDVASLRAIDTIRSVVPSVGVAPPVESGAGAGLLSRAANLETDLINWVRGTQATAAESGTREAGATTDIETTGIRFGQN